MLLYVLLCCVGVVHCYGHGRVSGVCGSMTPSHGANAQTSTAPFTVTADKTTFKEGDQITGETVILLLPASHFQRPTLLSQAVKTAV